MCAPTTSKEHCLEIVASGIRQEKVKTKTKPIHKTIQIGKEGVKLPLFADDMIILQKPIEFTKKLLELINEFSKFAGLKSIYKN